MRGSVPASCAGTPFSRDLRKRSEKRLLSICASRELRMRQNLRWRGLIAVRRHAASRLRDCGGLFCSASGAPDLPLVTENEDLKLECRTAAERSHQGREQCGQHDGGRESAEGAQLPFYQPDPNLREPQCVPSDSATMKRRMAGRRGGAGPWGDFTGLGEYKENRRGVGDGEGWVGAWFGHTPTGGTDLRWCCLNRSTKRCVPDYHFTETGWD